MHRSLGDLFDSRRLVQRQQDRSPGDKMGKWIAIPDDDLFSYSFLRSNNEKPTRRPTLTNGSAFDHGWAQEYCDQPSQSHAKHHQPDAVNRYPLRSSLGLPSCISNGC